MAWSTFRFQFAFLLTSLYVIDVFSCPVCGFGQDGSADAFLLTTGLMTLVPLMLGGGFILFLRHLKKKEDHESGTSPLDR